MRRTRVAEYRAEVLKGLNEQRNDKITELQGLVDTAKGETRAMSDEEQTKFTALEKEIADIDATIAAEERARKLEPTKPTPASGAGNAQEAEQRAQAEKSFDAYLRGRPSEIRATGDMSVSGNGNIIPAEFSSDIIRKLTELSGIFNAITRVNSKGTYKQIIEKNKITAGWTEELAEVQQSAASWDILEIGHHKLGALVMLSYEMLNQAEFSVISEVTTQMLEDFQYKTEEGVINGTGSGQPTGLMSSGTPFTLASATAIEADELVKILHKLKARYVANAKWLISQNTLCEIRLLKDSDGKYLFHEAELTSGYAGYILGKPVLLSEVMPDFQVLFGDFGRAYKANVNPEMTVKRLEELYATQGAVGVLGFLWMDGKPVNKDAYVVARSA